MITGHLGIAMGARSLDRREGNKAVPLLFLIAATVSPDLLDGLLSLRNYCNPEGSLSHSLPAVALLAVLFAAAAYAFTRSATTALFCALLVCLHLPPDYITGRKALWPDGPVWGLYVYRWGWIDFLVELPVVITGWWMLRRSRYTPHWVVSGIALALLITVQGAFDVSNTVNGPRPPRTCTRTFP